jgi:broad specificity phosphatase PhoE
MRIYIVRHADPIYETDSITEEGQREAEALADYLVEEEGVTHIYSSTMGRAIATATPAADKLGVQVTTRKEFCEFKLEKVELSGDYVPKGKLAVWDIPAEFNRNLDSLSEEERKNVTDIVERAKAHKSVAGLAEFSNEFIKEFGYVWHPARKAFKVEKANEFKVAVVCHNGFGLAWIAHLLGMPFESIWNYFWLAPSSVTTVLFDHRSSDYAVPRLLQVGSTAHLFKAGLKIPNSKYENDGKLPSGIKANFY